MLCKHMKIDSENLRWYAAFHIETHHPHVHLMVYSAKDNDGFLTEPAIEADLLLLSQRLQNTGGKKVYGYLKADVKAIIDRIVDELAKDERIDKLYRAWGDWQNEILSTYTTKLPPLPPLSQQKQFMSIRNMVITEALRLGGHHFSFEDEATPEPVLPDDAPPPEESMEPEDVVLHAEWSKQYKLARKYLFGSKDMPPDFDKAFRLFLLEAEIGNGLTMHDLGRMYADGLGREIDTSLSQEWYTKALTAFLSAERENPAPYLQYRIGYLEKSAKQGNINAQYLLGKVCLETGFDDPAQAVAWMTKAAEAGNAAAQYSLGKLYRDGTHVEKDIQKAVALFTAAAEQKNEYAAYQLGRLYLAREDITRNVPEAIKRLTISSDLGNAYAQYALGKLYLAGEDMPKDVTAAIQLFTLSAEQKNEFAAYQIGKLYLKGEDVPKDTHAAIRWLTASAELGNQFAQYALGKLYFYDGDVPRDKEKSLYWLGLAAAQGNVYALYLIENINNPHNPSVLLATTRLFRQLENLFREDYRRSVGVDYIDRRRRLQEKKQAQGHARDDHAPQLHL